MVPGVAAAGIAVADAPPAKRFLGAVVLHPKGNLPINQQESTFESSRVKNQATQMAAGVLPRRATPSIGKSENISIEQDQVSKQLSENNKIH